MADTLFIILGLIAAVHVYTYGHWLMLQNNRAGAFFTYLLAVGSVVMPIIPYLQK